MDDDAFRFSNIEAKLLVFAVGGGGGGGGGCGGSTGIGAGAVLELVLVSPGAGLNEPQASQARCSGTLWKVQCWQAQNDMRRVGEENELADLFSDLLAPLVQPESIFQRVTARLHSDARKFDNCRRALDKKVQNLHFLQLSLPLGPVMSSSEEEVVCSVCFDPPGAAGYAVLPCCGQHEESTTRFCNPCIVTICSMSQLGVGKCPRCRATIGVRMEGDKVVIEKKENVGQCRMCMQTHTLVNAGMCVNCNLGRRYCFQYECDRCHRTQRIAHPMFIYQATPADFSSASWACRG